MARIHRILSIIVALAASMPAATATAQTSPTDDSAFRVIGGAAWTRLWDDETSLGQGLLISGGLAKPIGSHLQAEGELTWGTHHRNSGYLEADGRPTFGTARLAYLFGSPDSAARAFASGGLTVVHSTGHFTWHSFMPDPRGFPIEGPTERREWSLTKGGFELAGGVRIRAGDRLGIRPEFRWIATSGQTPVTSSTLSTPILALRGGVTLEWRLGR